MRRRRGNIPSLAVAVLVACFAGPGTAAGPDALSPVLAGLSDRVTTAISEDRLVSVSLAVVLDEKIVFCRAFGLADPQQNEKATPQTIYPAGSVTKLFTATMLARLWEQGVVDLECFPSDSVRHGQALT